MNNKTIAITAVLILAMTLVGYGSYRYGVSRPAANADRQSSLIDPATGKRVLYWHDPMTPGQRFDKPGKSPFMDMQLVPVFAEEGATHEGVVIDPRVQQRLGVRTAIVEKKSLALDIVVAGNVEYNERDVAVVQARANGFIEHVHVRTPLQAVRDGQELADVYMPEWVAAQEEYLTIERMQSNGRENLLAAATQRMRLVGMSDADIAVVAKTKVVQARLSLRAPIAGVVTEVSAREGMTVVSGAPLFRINGVNTVWVYGEVPEAHLAQIKPGVGVSASATALPGALLQGKVLALLPEVSAATRTAKARIELQNDKRLLAPGMFVTVHFAIAPQAATLTVPSEAIIATGAHSVVIVAEDASHFKPVMVVTGTESNGVTEIRSGLEEGQQVVTSAQFLIDSEASLKGALMRMSDGPSTAPSPQPSPIKGEGAWTPSPLVGEGGGEGSQGHGAHQ